MVHLLLVLNAAFISCIHGIPLLPSFPTRADGCFLGSSEVEVFRVEGDAVILSFPMLERALQLRKIALPSQDFIMSKDGGTEAVANQHEGRVLQVDKQLWLLPTKASDSGEYSCTYRNETYCVTGSIRLQVYKADSVDMAKLSYPFFALMGHSKSIMCPSLDDFNKTDRLISWVKSSGPTGLRRGHRSSFREDNGRLQIPVVNRFHHGVYTCQLRVLINNRRYNVSRAILLRVKDSNHEALPTPTEDDYDYMTSHTWTADSYQTTLTPNIRPPVIVSPLNGTTVDSAHGSAVELFCKAVTGCDVVDSTVVTWLVNGQSVESSYLNERALQGAPSVSRQSESCQTEVRLILLGMTDDDVKTEVTCVAQNGGGRREAVVQFQLEDSTFTWLVVAVVAASCFLVVVSIFLYVLFKPKGKRKMDYILARQGSTL